MRNKSFHIIYILIINILTLVAVHGENQFNFDVTQIEVLESGNKIKGIKRGVISTDSNIIIESNEFNYNKILNIFNAKGKVKIQDKVNKVVIYSNDITYLKDKEEIFTESRSKAINNEIIINANSFKYEKNLSKLNAIGDVVVENKLEDYIINAQEITFFLDEEKILTIGKTETDIKSKYNFKSENVTYSINEDLLSSKNKTIIKDTNSNIFNLDNFEYSIQNKELKGSNILMISNFGLPKSDKIFFSNAIINLENNKLIGKDTKIEIHREVFGEKNNKPRLYGVSATRFNNITTLNKGVFTSCGDTDTCPPWSISAEKIIHDKNKKTISYNNALLKIYDKPVLYFPKFFHPDPSVDRQSGLLKPQINSSNVLGESIYLPYFHVISENRDFTFRPTLFEGNMQMFRNEYRQVNLNSSFIADFSLTKGYKSSSSANKNSISHLFAKFKSDLNFKNYNKSDLFLSIQRVSNDTYLKVFDTNLIDTESELKPNDKNNLTSEVKFELDHDDFNFTTGLQAFENLQLQNSDRYQYVLPHYDFNKTLSDSFFNGSLELRSSGDNNLRNTNNLETRVINDLEYKSNNIITNLGFLNNYNIYFKNLGTLGKNTNKYKSSPQMELMNIIELNSSLPLKRIVDDYSDLLTSKLSLRINPSDMKNHTTSNRKITADNIFDINRLGLADSFEAGKSLTFGIEYKREKLEDINKFFEFKLATSFRENEDNFIPSTSSLNKKNSNLFGSITSNLNEYLVLDYDFILDNNYDKFEFNSVNAILNVKNFKTNFKFIEENGFTGDTNFLENTTSYNFNDKNSVLFKTRRNRKLNLTEFYDLVYEYQNDCLVASIKYNKTYYNDRELKPTENLFFSITLFPLTTYEHGMNKND